MPVQCPSCRTILPANDRSLEDSAARCPNCGATVSLVDDRTNVVPRAVPASTCQQQPSLHIDGYVMHGVLGEGGMGIVYEAEQISLKRKVAIKVLAASLAEDPNYATRFQREIAALVHLAHPNIVTIFDQGRASAGQVYFVMEYVEGREGGKPTDLRKLMDTKALDFKATRQLIVQVIRALGFAHRQGVVHRDIKPSNVLVDRHGNAKILDFGIAALVQQPIRQLTMCNQSIGTFDYMAPEQRRNAATVDQRADVYATGVMLYEMLTGSIPTPGYAAASALLPGLDPRWDSLIAKAMHPDPAQRLANMEEFENSLAIVNDGQVGVGERTDATVVGSASGTAVGTSIRCSKCDTQCSPSVQFCPSCGSSVWVRCPKCQTKAAADVKYCVSCGADVENQRLFEEYFELGKRSAREADQQESVDSRLDQLGEAGLALARALTYVQDSADARHLLDQVNRTSIDLAWQAAEAAIREKRFGEASRFYEQVLVHQPDHCEAKKRFDEILRYRSNVLVKAQEAWAASKAEKAVRLLQGALESFPGDSEIESLAERYSGTQKKIDESVKKLPLLKAQNRLWEAYGLVQYLQSSGMPIQGLPDYAAGIERRMAAAAQALDSARQLLAGGKRHKALVEAGRVLQEIADHPAAIELVELAKQKPKLRHQFLSWSYFFSLALGIAAVVMCVVALQHRWIAIPPAQVDLRDRQARWQYQGGGFLEWPRIAPYMIQPAPRSRPTEAVYRMGIAATFWLILLATAIPWRRLRGWTFLAVATGAALIFHLLMGPQILKDLAEWTPSMRLLLDSHLTSEQSMFGPAIVFLSIAITLLNIAAGLNLFRFRLDRILFFIIFLAGAVLGNWYSYVAFKDVPANLELNVAVDEPKRIDNNSWATVKISLRNASATPIAILDSSQQDRRWAAPDTVLFVNKLDDENKRASLGDENVRIIHDSHEFMGCVVRPNSTELLAVRIPDVWLPGEHKDRSLAGDWQAVVKDGYGSELVRSDFAVAGIPHPRDRKLADVKQEFDSAHQAAKDAIDKLNIMSGTDFTSDKINGAVEAARSANAALAQLDNAVDELKRHGQPFDKNDSVVRDCENNREAIGEFLAVIDGSSAYFARGLRQESGLARSLRGFLPLALVEQARKLAQSNPENACTLLVRQSQRFETNKGKAAAAELLRTVVNQEFAKRSLHLLLPDGSTPDVEVQRWIAYAIEQADSLDPPLKLRSENEDLAFAKLALSRDSRAGLTPQAVNRFLQDYPKSRRLTEIKCWLGFNALGRSPFDRARRAGDIDLPILDSDEIAPDFSSSRSHFQAALNVSTNGEYRQLAQLGSAIADFGGALEIWQASGRRAPTDYYNVLHVQASLATPAEVADWSDALQELIASALGPKGQRAYLREIAERRNRFEIVRTTDSLAKTLQRLDELSVIWIQLSFTDLENKDHVKPLKQWVDNGGVLWVDTNLSKDFGIDGDTTPSGMVEYLGWDVRQPVAAHMNLGTSGGVQNTVLLILGGSWLVKKQPGVEWIITTNRAPKGTKVPDSDRGACAVRKERDSKGLVIYRPRLVRDENGIEHFERGLYLLSLGVLPGRD